jgi:CubicO group peptidase (beta-lactamase class C family)
MNTIFKIAGFSLIFFPGLSFGQNGTIQKLNGELLMAPETENIIMGLMDRARVSGLEIAVLNDNEATYIHSFGFKNQMTKELLDTSTVFYGASLSKAVFAYVCLLLVQEGVLDLDKPLYRYLDRPLPEYKNYLDLKDDDRWKLITARMCLSHTTGFPNWRFINARSGEFDPSGKLAIYFTPGTKYAYSGEGIALLQMVMEKITGKNLQELAEKEVFEKIGMKRTSYVWKEEFESNYALGNNKDGIPLPKKKRTTAGGAGSLETTVADYARFVQYIMQGKGLNEKMRNTMLTPQITISSQHQFPTITEDNSGNNGAIELSYGLGWGLLKCRYGRAFFKEGHDEGWQHYNINFIDRGIGIVIMTNSSNGEGIFKELLEKIIGDTFTPWRWEGYTPFNEKVN